MAIGAGALLDPAHPNAPIPVKGRPKKKSRPLRPAKSGDRGALIGERASFASRTPGSRDVTNSTIRAAARGAILFPRGAAALFAMKSPPKLW
jgi:hypothetical protein